MSQYADEGTVAHELAAMCLREGTDAAAYIGRIIECQDYEHSKLGPSGAHRWMRCAGSVVLEAQAPFKPRKFALEVTDETAEYVQEYVESIRTYALGNLLLIEQSLDISHVLGDGQGGTGDAVIIADRGAELQIHDLKFGRGVEVFAEDNEQMLLYAAGARRQYEMLGDFERFRAVIHQPRVKSGPDEWTCTAEELDAFEAVAAEAAALCNELLGPQPEELDPLSLTPGEKQCRFCKAKAVCPALTRQVSNDVFDDFDVIANPDETAEPRSVSNDARRLGTLMDRLALIEDWCRAVRAKGEAETLAGNPPIGADGPYKVVQGRKGNRAWIDAAEVEAALKRMRLRQEQMYSFKLITPPVAQKLLKGQPKRWNTLTALITQPAGKLHVAPASDTRPAVEPNDVTDDFDTVE